MHGAGFNQKREERFLTPKTRFGITDLHTSVPRKKAVTEMGIAQK